MGMELIESAEILAQVMGQLSDLSNDRKVPRNVRSVIDSAIRELQGKEENIATKINTTISMLDEVSNDPNIHAFTRTQIWNIVSLLESANSDGCETH